MKNGQKVDLFLKIRFFFYALPTQSNTAVKTLPVGMDCSVDRVHRKITKCLFNASTKLCKVCNRRRVNTTFNPTPQEEVASPANMEAKEDLETLDPSIDRGMWRRGNSVLQDSSVEVHHLA